MELLIRNVNKYQERWVGKSENLILEWLQEKENLEEELSVRVRDVDGVQVDDLNVLEA